ncbi:alpha-glucosidase/alpha-galactosidase [Pelagibacteraceae bacterium]|nr:alpha-glucosidase/alpha-galactosidase [Pelagibacteraceae bacterium]
MTKLTIIGAGSAVFTKNIVTDLLSLDSFKKMEIALQDIDTVRLKASHELLNVISEKLNASPKITSYTDRRESLVGSDFVQTTIQVGGYKPSTVIDFEIPREFGLKQTIADTLGIGGIMRGLRTIPVLLDIAKDIMEVCPKALWLQYVNPMCANMIAINNSFPEIKTVGLCHSVQGTAEMLAKDLGEKVEDIEYLCVGINHMAFYQKFEKKSNDSPNEDLYPRLKIIADKIVNDEKLSSRSEKINHESDKILYEKVRYEILRRFGYFVTESSEHFAEYVPWFIKQNRQDVIDKYKIPIEEYIDRCKHNIKLWDELEKDMSPIYDQPLKRSNEYASYIMDAVVNNNKITINANVMNDSYIENLPSNCCVEVPCLINSNGYSPHKFGKLPEQLAALMRTNINVQILTAEAALTRKKEYIYHAAMLDPLTAANLTIDEIYSMTDKMIEAHQNYLPKYN